MDSSNWPENTHYVTIFSTQLGLRNPLRVLVARSWRLDLFKLSSQLEWHAFKALAPYRHTCHHTGSKGADITMYLLSMLQNSSFCYVQCVLRSVAAKYMLGAAVFQWLLFLNFLSMYIG